jgi:Ca-activated chloride channel family protein
VTWHNPTAFVLFILIALFIGYHFLILAKKKPTLKFSSLSQISKLPKGMRAYLSQAPLVLKILALIFLTLALARPQMSDTKVKRNVEGIDIMIALDISDSMMIEDMQPKNRMESSKKNIQDFINKRISDRIGLVVFAGESYTRVPLTLDYPILLDSLKKVEPTSSIKMGTAIGVALANAVARLKDSTAKSRVIILLTDGENNSGTIDPETALDIAKGFGIKIYSIGAGVDGEAQLPIIQTDPFGRTIKTYQPIHSTVNDDLLGRLASETGGKYYRASSGGALEKVFKDIDRLEKTKIDVNKFTKYTELYQKYLQWALYLLIASVFLRLTILRKGP